NAGTYAIVDTLIVANYEGRNTGCLTINKAIATVNISNNSFTYDGSPKTATAVTLPTGLFVNFGYDGDFVNDPEDAGIYAVEGIIQDSNYQGSGTGTLTINKAQGIITITNLYQNFNGTPKAVTTSTNPSGLTVDVLYNGFAAVPSAVGSYVIEATIDDNNYEGQKNETLIINGAPSTSGLVNVNVNEDADNVYFNLYNAFSDLEDADSELIYSIQGNTNPTLFSAVVISGSSLIIDFAANQFGSATITVRATDQGGLFVNTSSTITVAAVQDDPEFTSSAITGAVQDQIYSYNVTTSDADPGDVLTITSLIALPAWLNLLDNGDGTAVLTGTPTNSDAGQTFGIALSVSDDKGNDENQFFNILVSNSNDAPFFTSTPITTATQDIEYTYFINSDDDDSGDVLSLSAPTLPDWLSLVDNGDGSGSIIGTPDNTDTGTNAVLLRVIDNSGATEDQSFNINVGNANDAPFFTSTPIVNATEDALYTYNISVDDDDIGDELEITVLSKPSWLTLTDNGNGTATLTGTPLNQNVGSSSVVLNVRDQDGASVNQNFSITVTNTNDAPQFTSTPVTVAIQDAVYTYNVQATDPDVGDVLMLTATQKPSWLTFTNNGSGTATLTGTPTNADLGSNPVTLRVVDNSGAAINQVFTINVDNQNDPPSFTSTPVQSVNEDAVYTYNITTTDPDAGDTRTIIALSLPGWLGLSDNGNGTAVLAGTPLNQHVGNSSVVLNVRDALGANVNQNFTISVANTNDAPVFLTAPITSAVQDIAYSYNVNTDDPDLGDQVSLSVEILPSWLTFTNNGDGSGRISGTPTNANLGANQVQFVATDNSGVEVVQDFTIVVNNTNDAPSFTSTPL
ncbi:MAG: putative Ig domain-containing protein, partial [Fulvivirga sp.]